MKEDFSSLDRTIIVANEDEVRDLSRILVSHLLQIGKMTGII